MKKILLALLAVAGFTANAQKLDNALLWKITGKGLTQPSYLFGTIHITCDATLDAKTKKALDDTKQIYLELDMDDPGMQAAMMGGIMMKDGVTMSSLVSAEDFKIVDEFLTKNVRMSAKMMDSFKPALISAMLYPKMIDCPMQSFEMELMKEAVAQNEEILGLESVADQMNVFDAIPYKDQMNELVKTAKGGINKDKKEFAKLMAVYQSKDIEGMHKLMDESENKMYSKFEDVMLDNRNKKWIPVIEAAAKRHLLSLLSARHTWPEITA
ncbi:TraB/GumN family protein [Flavobacterium sp. J372]|uniref:TraB/GumN family protein n=1 Tax=Flavobacterium sp. J372 TaxID=2898436 RepID=UPI0021513B3C|nr:TraB/GumN family protein [Flavobacterium sp. J372]